MLASQGTYSLSVAASMLRNYKICSTVLFIAVCAVSALSGLPSRPSYSFGRGRLSMQGTVETATSEATGSLDLQAGTDTEEREQLYAAYNALHSLAQDFKKPFDSPAVLVVGHQTSGKSALMEALMGFQFNQVFTPHCLVIHLYAYHNTCILRWAVAPRRADQWLCE